MHNITHMAYQVATTNLANMGIICIQAKCPIIRESLPLIRGPMNNLQYVNNVMLCEQVCCMPY